MNSTLTMKVLPMNKPQCSSKQKCIKNVKGICKYHDWCIYKIIKDKPDVKSELKSQS